jgi:hypothetical protein
MRHVRSTGGDLADVPEDLESAPCLPVGDGPVDPTVVGVLAFLWCPQAVGHGGSEFLDDLRSFVGEVAGFVGIGPWFVQVDRPLRVPEETVVPLDDARPVAVHTIDRDPVLRPGPAEILGRQSVILDEDTVGDHGLGARPLGGADIHEVVVERPQGGEPGLWASALTRVEPLVERSEPIVEIRQFRVVEVRDRLRCF